MNRRIIVFVLMLFAIVSVASIVCQAESQTLLTRHVREAVLDGQAKIVGSLPATQSLHFDIVLALSHPAELKKHRDQFRSYNHQEQQDNPKTLRRYQGAPEHPRAKEHKQPVAEKVGPLPTRA